MTGRAFLSRFTPSRTDPRDLEAIFVQREDLLQDAVERVAASARSAAKHHLLFVGPRGCGKTHFVTLLFHRLEAQPDLKDVLRIAWLNEDETSTSLLDLLVRIHTALCGRYPSEYSPSDLDEIRRAPLRDPTEKLTKLLLERLGSRCLLILVENLDDLFDHALGDDGQRELRALLQNHRSFSMVATAQALFKGVQSREAPFYGFFQIEHLAPLDIDNATELLRRIARLNGEAALDEFLDTPAGKARMRALHHLSGGNHRLYIVFSDLVTRETMDALVRPFDEMLDELTPYYQERLRALSPLQRKIVEHLCKQHQPVPVKQIADTLFTTPQSISSQLMALRELGYVESNARGRESLYELSEPLMRLCVEIKENQRREPLRLIVDFLRAWYDEDQLHDGLSSLDPKAPEYGYVVRALESMRSGPDLRIQYLLDDLCAIDQGTPAWLQARTELIGEIQSGLEPNFDGFKRGLTKLSQALDRPNLPVDVAHGLRGLRAMLNETLGREDDVKADCDAAIEGGDLVGRTAGLWARAQYFHRHGDTQSAIADWSALIDMALPLNIVQLTARFRRAGELHKVQQDNLALLDLDAALSTDLEDQALRARCLQLRADIHLERSNLPDACADFASIAALSGIPIATRQVARFQSVLARMRFDDHSWSEMLHELDRTLDGWSPPGEFEVVVLGIRAALHTLANQPEAAIADYTQIVQHAEADPETVSRALYGRCRTHLFLGAWEPGLDDLRRAFAAAATHEVPLHLDASELVALIQVSGLGPQAWDPRIASLLQLYAEVGALPALGSGLVRSLARLENAGLDANGLNAWRDAWLRAGGDQEDLKVALRIFTKGIEYLKTHDRGVLLDLLQEERSILEEALALAQDAVAKAKP